MQVHAVSAYEEPLKTLVLAKTWSDYGAGKALGTLLWQKSVLRDIPCDYFVPIPLHYTRYAYRGFNQCYIIAKQLSLLSGKPVLDCLKRTRRTPVQSLFSRLGRHKNVEGSITFMGDAAALEGKSIILIDDLMMSGATLHEAGRALVKAGSKEIYAVVACRVLY